MGYKGPVGNVGHTLHNWRIHRGLDQQSMGDLIGTSRVTINQLERGLRSLTPEMALALEDATRITAEEWMRYWITDALMKARRQRKERIAALMEEMG